MGTWSALSQHSHPFKDGGGWGGGGDQHLPTALLRGRAGVGAPRSSPRLKAHVAQAPGLDSELPCLERSWVPPWLLGLG